MHIKHVHALLVMHFRQIFNIWLFHKKKIQLKLQHPCLLYSYTPFTDPLMKNIITLKTFVNIFVFICLTFQFLCNWQNMNRTTKTKKHKGWLWDNLCCTYHNLFIFHIIFIIIKTRKPDSLSFHRYQTFVLKLSDTKKNIPKVSIIISSSTPQKLSNTTIHKIPNRPLKKIFLTTI